MAGTTAPPCLYPALLGACSDESVPPPCFNSDVRIFQGSEMKTQSTETTEMLSSDRRNAACFHMKQCWHCCGLTVHSRGTEEPEAGLERLPTFGKVSETVHKQSNERKQTDSILFVTRSWSETSTKAPFSSPVCCHWQYLSCILLPSSRCCTDKPIMQKKAQQTQKCMPFWLHKY